MQLQRGVVVKKYLASKDLQLERLLLGAGNLGKTEAILLVLQHKGRALPAVPCLQQHRQMLRR